MSPTRAFTEQAFDPSDPKSLMIPNVVLIGTAAGLNPSLSVAFVIDDRCIRRLLELEIPIGAFQYQAEIFETMGCARAVAGGADPDVATPADQAAVRWC